MEKSELIEKVNQTVDAIYQNDYYLHLWDRVKHTAPIETLSKSDLLKPFQNFWSLLPDYIEVRRAPFFMVCDLAEEYCFGDEE